MKKVISVLLAVVMVMGLVSCGKAPKHKKDRDDKDSGWIKVTDNVIPDDDGLMLTIRESNSGEVCNTDDYWVADYYEIYNDGTIRKTVSYNLSLDRVTEEKLSDKDLQALYDFKQWCIEDDPFSGYSEDCCDGCSWSFGYYDENDEYVRIYSGYAYGNKDLGDIQDIVCSYFS